MAIFGKGVSDVILGGIIVMVVGKYECVSGE